MNDIGPLVIKANLDLSKALAAVYATFSCYPAPRMLEASPLRNADEILSEVTSAPLKQLTASALGPYASYAMTTVGDVVEYKHFLPRIIHLAVIGGEGEPGLDASLIASKLVYGQWLQWPAGERDAINGVFEAAWNRLRYFHPDDCIAQDWLYAFAILGEDLIAKLDALLRDPSTNANAQFAHFVSTNADGLDDPDSHWGRIHAAVRSAIRVWLGRKDVSEALRVAQVLADERDLWLFELALGKLMDLRSE